MSTTSADRPIADYGFIGDMRGAALVASNGDIDWLCLGRFDADPVLLALLDGERGGRCTVAFGHGFAASGRRYVEGTNILETSFSSHDSTVVVTDFMPVAAARDPGNTGPDSTAAECVVRLVRCTRGHAVVTMRVEPAFDWARRTTTPDHDDGIASYDGEDFHVASSAALSIDRHAVTATVQLTVDASVSLVLSKARPTSGADTATAHRQLVETRDYWLAWSARCTYDGSDAALALRSALCLKLLTYAPSGGMIAAPTAGLPEVVGGVRNWDYRYVWTRDASFSVSAFLVLGFQREAAEFLRFLHEACDHGEAVRVMYTVDGPLPETKELDHLAGWRGSSPITIGNDASEQDQFEIYGELLVALGEYVDRYGVRGLCQELVADLPAFVGRLAEAAIANWQKPDQGIWELKGDARHIVHSKAMCWVALDRAIALAPALGFVAPAEWHRERDRIHGDCLARGWSETRQSLTMEYAGSALDMAVLRLPILGFIAADDPRVTATLAALTDALGAGDLYRRYRIDDALPGEEGAFVACSFWMAAVRMMRGEIAVATALMHSLLARANDLGLYAEEIDPDGGEQLGNFPQAFTHMTVVHEIVRLDRARRDRTDATAMRIAVDEATARCP